MNQIIHCAEQNFILMLRLEIALAQIAFVTVFPSDSTQIVSDIALVVAP